MNSVLQQLFMIESVRNGVLEAEEACNDPDEDFSSEDRDEINENENNAATGEVNYVVKIWMLFEMFSDQLIHMIRNYVHTMIFRDLCSLFSSI